MLLKDKTQETTSMQAGKKASKKRMSQQSSRSLNGGSGAMPFSWFLIRCKVPHSDLIPGRKEKRMATGSKTSCGNIGLHVRQLRASRSTILVKQRRSSEERF